MGEDAATRKHPDGQERSRSAIPLVALIAALVTALAPAACGGEDRRAASEPAGDYPVEVRESSFPARQRLAEISDLRLAIENAGSRTIPDLAVTIWTGDESGRSSFAVRSEQSGLADPERPAWILEQGYPKLLGPGVRRSALDDEPTAGAAAAQTGTFSFGPLAPGESADIVWRLTPVAAGEFTVHYEIAAGLEGQARAVSRAGRPVAGELAVAVSDKPARVSVDDRGRVVIED